MSRDTAESPRLVTGTNPRRGPKAAWSIERRRRLAIHQLHPPAKILQWLMYWHMGETNLVARLRNIGIHSAMAPLRVFAHMEQHFFECCLCRFQNYHLHESCGTNHWEAMGRFRVLEVNYVGTGFCEHLSQSSGQLLAKCRSATQPFVAEAFLATAASHKAVAPIHPPTSKTTESGLVIIWVNTFRQKTGKVSDLIWFDVYWTMNLWWWWTSIPSPNSFHASQNVERRGRSPAPSLRSVFPTKTCWFRICDVILVVYILKTCWQIKRN